MRFATFTVLAPLCLAAGAAAAEVPFTEHFSSNSAGWRDSSTITDLAWVAAGGPDGGSYASGPFSFVSQAAGGTPVIYRAQSNYPSSGNAFFGDWLTDGVTLVTAMVRHDAPVPLTFFGRFAQSPAPGAVALNFVPVAPNTWTELTFPIDPASPQFISFEGSDFSTVFSNIQRLHFGVSVPAALAGDQRTFTFDIDQVTIIPAPAALPLFVAAGLLGARRRR